MYSGRDVRNDGTSSVIGEGSLLSRGENLRYLDDAEFASVMWFVWVVVRTTGIDCFDAGTRVREGSKKGAKFFWIWDVDCYGTRLITQCSFLCRFLSTCLFVLKRNNA